MFISALIQASCLVLISTDVSVAKKLNFLTYNMRLAHHYNNNNWTERRDPIIQELSESKADVICLQEAWFSTDIADIIGDLEDQYPFHFSGLHLKHAGFPVVAAAPMCTVEELGGALAECGEDAIAHCLNITDFYDNNLCLMKYCIDSVLQININCRYCTSLVGPDNSNPLCFVPSQLVMNTYGTLVLSKKKILNGTLVRFEADVADEDKLEVRGMLEMDIKGIDGKVVCSFNTEENELFPEYLEPNLQQFKSFEERNYGQIQEMLDRYQNETNIIIMGSFGTGPNYKRRVAAEYPKSYKAIKNADPPYQRSSTRKPTAVYTSGLQEAVDHIFVRGHKMKSSRIAFLSSSYSDHGAVSANVRLARN